MNQKRKDEIFKKLNEEYAGRKVIIKSGQEGEIVKVNSANGFEMPNAFDIKIGNTIYDIPVCSVVGIEKVKNF